MKIKLSRRNAVAIGKVFAYIAIIAIVAISIVLSLNRANKQIKAMKPNPETTETEFRKFMIAKAKEKNAEKMKGVVEAKRKQKEIGIPIIKKSGNRIRLKEQTRNYLKITIHGFHHDLTLSEIQEYLNNGWVLISTRASDSNIMYFFRKNNRLE
jgi:hypothetical protein